jgi:hypothetical protein
LPGIGKRCEITRAANWNPGYTSDHKLCINEANGAYDRKETGRFFTDSPQKVAAITGAARGIGAALILELEDDPRKVWFFAASYFTAGFAKECSTT